MHKGILDNSRKDWLKVMIVDDDITARMLAVESLSQQGFAVLEAEDGLQALHVFAENNPDIVLMDVDMPKLDGFESCRQLRSLGQGRTVPILMVTGRDDIASIERAYEAGATDFTSKPINWRILGHRIRYMVRASEVLKQLRKSEARLDNAQRLAKLGNWEWEKSSKQIIWSEQVFRMLGLHPDGGLLTLEALIDRVNAEDKERVKLWFDNVRNKACSPSIILRVKDEAGQELTLQMQAETEADISGNIGLTAGTILDVTQLKQAESRIIELAHFDALTGLANRLVFKERVDQALDMAQRYQDISAILFVDLDNFKRVNDTLGHSAGDQLLMEVATRLRNSVRLSDRVNSVDAHQVARFGGDEFAIVLTRLNHKSDAGEVAQRILTALAVPVMLDDNEVVVSSSIGIAIATPDNCKGETFLKNADTAMYYAKNSGKNRYEYYSEEMDVGAQRKLKLEIGLRRAIERNELYIVYQPQLELESETVVGVEALLRWRSPELGSVSPDEFISVAEDCGLIVSIGEWVLRKACAQAKAWLDDGLPELRMAVNLSARQFVGQDVSLTVAKVLDESGFPAASLELEITESVLIDDIKGATDILQKLKRLGVTLAIDDFGTGYSSLNYLKRFPVDRLKIDRSFITNITSNKNDAAMTLAMVAMAHSLKLNVVAEGVETAEQQSFLRERYCDEVQGFGFSRPISAQQVAELLSSRQKTHF